ncbi:MAG: PQQ-binding-like beta-propeller repeat protein, partial [Planctomycetia bacterium]
GVWREEGVVEKLPAKLTVKWRTPIGAGYAGPAVADGKVYVSDRQLNKGEANPADPFARDAVGGSERLLCLDAFTGEELWKLEYPCKYTISYPAGPRATPTVAGGKVYYLGAMGDFFCLDAATGKEVWRRNFVKDYGATPNAWGWSSAPLVVDDHVICLVGGKGSCVVAFNRVDGSEVWKALDADDFGYAPPMLFEAGGVKQLVVWNPVGLYGLNPVDGSTYWSQAFPLRYGLSIPTPIHDAKAGRLFVTAFYDGPLMMNLDPDKPAAALAWKGKGTSEIKTDGLHAIMATPFFDDGHIYGVCSQGQLRCLNADTGERVWETFKATGEGRWWNAFLVRRADCWFHANEQGELVTARLSPEGYEEISRAFLIEPTNKAQRRKVVWAHPAFANKSVYARNDKEIVCVDLATDGPNGK